MEAVVEARRLRLAFEDRHILSKAQRKEGLRRSWILLKSQLPQTISELSSHIIATFHLQSCCPHGIILSMDGFVLPPFESTCLLKDKDVISVKKKGVVCSELSKAVGGANSLGDVELLDKPLADMGVKLLANEEFDKETGEYESESEEGELRNDSEQLRVEDTPCENAVSKKRKPSQSPKRPSSKNKKRKCSRIEESLSVAEHVKPGETIVKKQGSSKHKKVKTKKVAVQDNLQEQDVDREPEKLGMAETDERSDSDDSFASKDNRSCQLDENGEGKVAASLASTGVKKVPSRSSRRKKAKRRWLKQQAQIIKEQQQKQLSGEDDKKLAGGKDDNQLSSVENCRVAENSQRVQNGTLESGVIPIVVRPGHIRFQPLDEDAGESLQENEMSVEIFQWNGITSKRKGQKWGKERNSSSRKSDSNNFTQTHSGLPPVEESVPISGHIELDKLAPYTSMPKEGDVVAYRLIELSSSWTPEVSSLRVGRVSFYDDESKRIHLQPVSEYPVSLEKKINEETSELQETSLYKEDGSLDIEYSALIDVRMVMHGNSNNTRSIIGEVNGSNVQCEGTISIATPSNGKAAALPPDAVPPSQENKVANPWDEINQALSAKKAQLLDQNGWNRTESSGKSAWSYRTLRGSALGPTMALLRAQNGI